MRFVYYTEKTVSQSMIALNERLQAKSSRSSLDGWVEKSGNFALSTTSKVFGRFPRTTRLQGKVSRENGLTTIKGSVSEGVTPRDLAIILAALVLLGVFIILRGNLLPGLIVIIAGAALTIPLTGDHHNSQLLIGEVQRTLKARETPPAAIKRPLETKNEKRKA